MKESYEFTFLGQTLLLSVQKALFWKEQSCLIIADAHLGKAGHFRKAGIPISSKIHVEDLQRLNQLVTIYQPRQLIFLGDLFHSDKNNEWDNFCEWRQQHQQIQVLLTIGNHDIFPREQYEKIQVEVIDHLHYGPFTMTHHPTKTRDRYNLCGHLHPGITLRGRSRQGISVPCFQFGKTGGLLPAFGNFTGYVAISPTQGDKVFAVTPTAIIAIQ